MATGEVGQPEPGQRGAMDIWAWPPDPGTA